MMKMKINQLIHMCAHTSSYLNHSTISLRLLNTESVLMNLTFNVEKIVELPSTSFWVGVFNAEYKILPHAFPSFLYIKQQITHIYFIPEPNVCKQSQWVPRKNDVWGNYCIFFPVLCSLSSSSLTIFFAASKNVLRV